MYNKRDYLSDEKDLQFEFGSEIPEGTDISELFFELTRRLRGQFDIDKGVLLIRNFEDDSFSAVSTWQQDKVRYGLKIKLPTEPSLFKKIADNGRVYSEIFSGIFCGNFFEKKLLINDDSQSFVVQPLKSDGQIVGMIGYSSSEPTAFAMIEEGCLNEISQKMGKIIFGQIS